MGRAFFGFTVCLIGLVLAPAARACGPEVVIRFIDSAPDIFIIENKSQEPWTLLTLEFRTKTSAGHVVFDTDFGGAGASEPQQFEPVEGEGPQAALARRPVGRLEPARGAQARDVGARLLRDVEHVLRHRDGVVLDGQGSRNLRLDRPDASSSEVRIVAAMR